MRREIRWLVWILSTFPYLIADFYRGMRDAVYLGISMVMYYKIDVIQSFQDQSYH
jgi:hypothetical protein